jgi:hypothetical protein
MKGEWKYKNFMTSDCHVIDDFVLTDLHSTYPYSSIASSGAVHNDIDK